MSENQHPAAGDAGAAAKKPSSTWQSGNAIWFFVGATFLFAWSAMLPADVNVALRVVMIVVGFAALAGGILEWVRAQRAADAKASRAASLSEQHDPPARPPVI